MLSWNKFGQYLIKKELSIHKPNIYIYIYSLKEEGEIEIRGWLKKISATTNTPNFATCWIINLLYISFSKKKKKLIIYMSNIIFIWDNHCQYFYYVRIQNNCIAFLENKTWDAFFCFFVLLIICNNIKKNKGNTRRTIFLTQWLDDIWKILLKKKDILDWTIYPAAHELLNCSICGPNRKEQKEKT